MPKAQNRPYFILLCSKNEVENQLAVCVKTEFRVETDTASGEIAVYDRDTCILRVEDISGYRMVWLHRAYYRHPFDLAPDGKAMPGIP
jgi:hypothetical protein